MLIRVTHMTMLTVVTCVMKVWNQSCQTSVTSLCPFLWLIGQVWLLTIECLVYQFVPNTSISRQSVSKLLIILPLFPVLPAWNYNHPRQDWRLCTTALLFCLPVRNISQRTFEHVPPCRRTTQLFLHEVFTILVIFQLLKHDYVIRTSPCIVQYLSRLVRMWSSGSRTCQPKPWDNDWLRVNHGTTEVMRAVFTKTLEPTLARRFARASSASGEVYCVHSPSLTRESLFPVSETLKTNQKKGI